VDLARHLCRREPAGAAVRSEGDHIWSPLSFYAV
jgi:hypothetical protein